MIAVFDSSAWIFLSKVGVVDKALALFDHSILPRSVHKEIAARNDEAFSALKGFLDINRVEIREAKNTRLVNALKKKLGTGESEAIVVGLELDADFVILDDHTARSTAIHLGLGVKGTLGILRRLMELGMIKRDLVRLYEDLRDMGFWVRESLFWDIFSDLRDPRDISE